MCSQEGRVTSQNISMVGYSVQVPVQVLVGMILGIKVIQWQ